MWYFNPEFLFHLTVSACKYTLTKFFKPLWYFCNSKGFHIVFSNYYIYQQNLYILSLVCSLILILMYTRNQMLTVYYLYMYIQSCKWILKKSFKGVNKMIYSTSFVIKAFLLLLILLLLLLLFINIITFIIIIISIIIIKYNQNCIYCGCI